CFGAYSAIKKLGKLGVKMPRVFLMPHGMLDPYFQKSKERRFKAIRNLVFWNMFEKKVVNGVNGVLFTCEQEMLLAREAFTGYRPANEINIGYGVPSPPSRNSIDFSLFFDKAPKVNNKRYILFLS